MNPTVVHEASHAAACVLLDRPVEFVEATPGHGFAGEQVGRCRALVVDEIKARELVVALIGYLSEGAPNWPPTYEEACRERREALDTIIRVLGMSEEIYAEILDATRTLLADPEFTRLRDSIARALSACPRLEASDVKRLAAIHLRQETACNT